MSSPEQAPEPTMDEILASIRKIIADDEPEGAQQAEGETQPDSAQPVQPGEGWNSGQENDSARGLNEGPAQPSVDDEILELRNELSARAGEPAEPRGDAFPGAAQETAAPETPQGSGPAQAEHGAPSSAASDNGAATSAASEEDILSALARAGIEHAGGQSRAGDGAADTLSQPAYPSAETPASGANAGPDFAGRDFAHEDAPGAQPAGAGQGGEPQPQAPTAASIDTGVYAPGRDEDLEADSPAGEAVQGFGQTAEPAAPAAGEPEAPQPGPQQAASADVATSGAASSEEKPLDTASALAALDEAAAAIAPDTESEQPETGLKQDAAPSAGVPAEAASPAGGQTLEESVKEMLRPMLREWLDNNMEDIIKSAVKEELNSSGYGNGGKT